MATQPCVSCLPVELTARGGWARQTSCSLQTGGGPGIDMSWHARPEDVQARALEDRHMGTGMDSMLHKSTRVLLRNIERPSSEQNRSHVAGLFQARCTPGEGNVKCVYARGGGAWDREWESNPKLQGRDP